ncbi:HAMP domain-containing sensor histidine kinase [Leucobacter iarius]|uniref:histidine kinase n=1 Tax=Leucobacter iarius TaxID=333963 RepID=A0ABN2L8P7_9MICO
MIVRRAVLRLAVVNSLVVLGIVALFAVGVERYASAAFDRDLPGLPDGANDAAEVAIQNLRAGLLICFAALLLVVPVACWLLARHSLRPVRESLETQQRFVDDASHELRTPISVAQGELELALLRDRDPEEYRAAMRSALAALEELGALTGDLLLLSRGDAEARVGSSERGRISVDELARRALAAVDGTPGAPIRVAESRDADIEGSPELLVRAVVNLLENARKFTPADGEIRLGFELPGSAVRISVSDTGAGMSPEDAARAFDRFWRADSARATPGRGIGLSIVRRVAELHGGSAEIRSTPGRGTTVSVELPFAQ